MPFKNTLREIPGIIMFLHNLKKICHRGNFSKDLQYSQDLLAERRVDHHILGELKWLGFSLKPVAGYGPKKRRKKSVEL